MTPEEEQEEIESQSAMLTEATNAAAALIAAAQSLGRFEGMTMGTVDPVGSILYHEGPDVARQIILAYTTLGVLRTDEDGRAVAGSVEEIEENS